MKVGIVGVGRVGGSAALNMALRDSCREMVLIDTHRQLAVSQALDISKTSALVSGPRVRAGDYKDLVDAEIVVLAPGIMKRQAAPITLRTRKDALGYWKPMIRFFAMLFLR